MPSEIVLGLIPFFYIWPPTLPSSLTPTHIASQTDSPSEYVNPMAVYTAGESASTSAGAEGSASVSRDPASGEWPEVRPLVHVVSTLLCYFSTGNFSLGNCVAVPLQGEKP